jgi:hypothetical protein
MKIKLEIRNFLSWDVDDLSAWHPLSPPDVYIPVELEIGETGAPGGHLFQIVVATSEGVREHHRGEVLENFEMMQRRGEGSGKEALVIFEKYDWREIQIRLKAVVEGCEKESWAESLDCLRKKFFWQYEGIKYK